METQENNTNQEYNERLKGFFEKTAKKKTKTMSVRLDPELINIFESVLKEDNNKTKSEVITEFILEYVKSFDEDYYSQKTFDRISHNDKNQERYEQQNRLEHSELRGLIKSNSQEIKDLNEITTELDSEKDELQERIEELERKVKGLINHTNCHDLAVDDIMSKPRKDKVKKDELDEVKKNWEDHYFKNLDN